MVSLRWRLGPTMSVERHCPGREDAALLDIRHPDPE